MGFKHKAGILNELTHHKVLKLPLHNLHHHLLLQDAPWEFSLTLTTSRICNSSSSPSQHHKTAATAAAALSLQRHRHKLCCLRLAVNGEQYNGSLPAV